MIKIGIDKSVNKPQLIEIANCITAREDRGVSRRKGEGTAIMEIIIDDTQGFDGVRIYRDYAPSLRANRSGLKTMENNLRIRKLTPKECYRLMGFDDIDHDRAAAVVSNSQLYKQAGNSICVPVIEHIFKKLISCGVLDE